MLQGQPQQLINQDLGCHQTTMHQVDFHESQTTDNSSHNQSQQEFISFTHNLSSSTNDIVELSHQQDTSASTTNSRRCSNSSTATSSCSQAIPDEESSNMLQKQSDAQLAVDRQISHGTLPLVNTSNPSIDDCPINQVNDTTATSDDRNIKISKDTTMNQNLDTLDQQSKQDDSNLNSSHSDSQDIDDDQDINKGNPF